MNEFANVSDHDNLLLGILKSHAVILWSMEADGRSRLLQAGPLESFPMSPVDASAGDPLLPYIHADDREEYESRRKRAIQERMPFAQVYRVGPIHGEYRIYFDKGKPSFSEDGRYLGHAGVAVDITDCPERELLVPANEAAHVASWDWDVRADRLTWSGEMERLFGFDPGTFQGTYANFMKQVHPEDRASVEEALAIARRDQGVYHQRFRILLLNGNQRWIASNGQFFYAEDGHAVRMRGISVDITDQVRAETQRRILADRFRLVALATNDAIWDWDLVTNQVWWNEGIRTLFGYPLEEVGPDSNWWSKNIHPDHFARVTSSIHAAIESGGEQWKDEYPYRRHDGTYIFVEDRGHIVRDACGKGVRMVGAMIDITSRRQSEEERRKLESQIQHAQKLESLGILAGGIAHDFNNLLTGMLGNASLALAELRPDSPARESVRQIEITAVRAAELTRQMLAYSGKGRFLVEPLNLSHLVEEMAHLLGTVISKRAILRFDFMPNLPLIKADATQIRQVIMNLITNASDAIGDKSGIIAVRTGVMHTDDAYMSSTTTDDELTPGFYVFAEISDTGCGMDEATVSKIFDPFFTTKFTGRGLGLAAVLGIVRGHRGAIKVYSEPGRGTTFKVLFPCAEGETVKEDVSSHAMGPWNGSGTILVVDDDESVRAVARKTLEQRGFRVLIAHDGMEGVEMFAEHQANIVAVLLDLTMPRMGGVEAFRELRRIRPDVRTVLMSGYNEEEVANQFLGKGLAGFLQKPFRATDLIQVVRQAIEK